MWKVSKKIIQIGNCRVLIGHEGSSPSQHICRKGKNKKGDDKYKNRKLVYTAGRNDVSFSRSG